MGVSVSFSLPVFNLVVNVWRAAAGPPAPPALTVKGNLAWGRRVFGGGTVFTLSGVPGMTLLLPLGADVRSQAEGLGNDIVEVPAGTGRFYTVVFVDDVGRGFGNQHRAAVLEQQANWPAPIP